MYHNQMATGKKILMPIIGVLLTLITLGWRASSRNANDDVITNPKDSSLDTIVLPPPENRESVEMITYQDPSGYEITYPAAWHTFDLTDFRYGDAYHYLSPLPINEDFLQRSLLEPVECDYGDPDGCPGYLDHYTETDRELLEIFARGFDSYIVMPAIFIPEEYRRSEQRIEFPSGNSGTSWITDTKNTRIIIIDNKRRNVRYHIVIRDPRIYGLDFIEDIAPILSSFRLT